jgi:hypothetical protein
LNGAFVSLSLSISFDVRGKALGQALHWSAPQVFGTRAKFITTTEPAYLELTVNNARHSHRAVHPLMEIKSVFTFLFSFSAVLLSFHGCSFRT